MDPQQEQASVLCPSLPLTKFRLWRTLSGPLQSGHPLRYARRPPHLIAHSDRSKSPFVWSQLRTLHKSLARRLHPACERAICTPMHAARTLAKPLMVSVGVTLAFALLSVVVPVAFHGHAVALILSGSTYFLVLRGDWTEVKAHGLGLGGLLAPQPLNKGRLLRATRRALLWTSIAALLTFPWYILGFVVWWKPSAPFTPDVSWELLNSSIGHVVAVAFPEELFYRGYLQSSIDNALPSRLRILGADVGWGLLIASAIFAVGHIVTTPDISRLAVFFPSLAFGWLRARTGGIGAAILFHAACNILAGFLGDAYGLF